MEPLSIIRDQLAGLYVSAVALIPNLIAGTVILLVTWLVANLAARLFANMLRRSHTRESLVTAAVTLSRSVIWLVGSLIMATIIFPDLTPASLLTGLGIGSLAVGLAFRDIFENFLAGILILIREPMKIGDDIQREGISGRSSRSLSATLISASAPTSSSSCRTRSFLRTRSRCSQTGRSGGSS